MKELEDDFLRDCLRTRTGVDVPDDINERIMAHIDNKVSHRLSNERLLVWYCASSVVVALGGLFWYFYYVGAFDLVSFEFGFIDVMWVFISFFATLFMVASLYLSRRLDGVVR